MAHVNSAVVAGIILIVLSVNSLLAPAQSKSVISAPFLNARDVARQNVNANAAPPCTWSGYNFTNINASDWYGVDNFNVFGYYLRICGSVDIGHCNSSLTRNSMICQVQRNDSKQIFNIATNAPSAVAWSWWNGRDVSDGIKFVTNNGDLCNGVPREVIGRLICDRSSTGKIVVSIDNPWHACTYNVTVPSPYVCANPQPQYV